MRYVYKEITGKPLKAGRQWPSNKALLKRRFAGGPMVARHCVLAGISLRNKLDTTNEVTHETAPLHSPTGDVAVRVVKSTTA